MKIKSENVQNKPTFKRIMKIIPNSIIQSTHT